MHDLALDDSQFIVATHSPILMAYQMRDQDTDHFKVKRDFLANPGRMLRVLMER
jgi:predicted ATPase